MQTAEVLEQIREISDPRARVIWERMGMPTERYLGAGLTKLKHLSRKVGRNHELALSLWDTEIHDARLLAAMIEEPKKVTKEQIEQQADDGQGFLFFDLSDKYCTELIAKTTYVPDFIQAWTDHPHEYLERSTYILLNEWAKRKKPVEDTFFLPYLDKIEAEIQHEKNWVKEGMIYALMGIGSRNPQLNARAIEVCEQVGPLMVNYGDTSCVTPDPLKVLKSDKVQAKLSS
ncbi:DNA alkylation repair protein [Marinicrinis sediminis]|uniref:DNA alkylation repair protein n=1 Tax=Marinicrinis sediminis TaxID=1652465 RepID=A0ABW5RGD8_9BACL